MLSEHLGAQWLKNTSRGCCEPLFFSLATAMKARYKDTNKRLSEGASEDLL